MHLRTIARRLLAATTLSLAVAASPALGQTADLSIAFGLRNAGITWGGAETYRATITNNGPTHVTSYTFTVALDSKLVLTAAPSNCVPVDTSPPIDPFPCVVTPTQPLLSGGTSIVDVGVMYPIPVDSNGDPTLNPATADCPADVPVAFASTATISDAKQGAVVVTDNPGNNSDPSNDNLDDWADLAVTSVTGPADAGEGQSVQYSVTVANNGPCTATGAFVDFVTPLIISITNLTGDCLNPMDDFYVANSAGCDLSDPWPEATTKTFAATYTVGTYPNEVIHAGLPIEVAISSDLDDPLGSNDSKSMLTQVDLSDNEGCSTGGAGTLLGLLSLVALRLGRRRAS